MRLNVRMFLKSLLHLAIVLLITMIAMIAITAFGDTGPSPLPTSGTVTLDWKIVLGAFGALAVAILDFIFAVNPAARSNGIFHWIYLALGGKDTPPIK